MSTIITFFLNTRYKQAWFIEVGAMITCTFNATANPSKPVDCIRRIAKVFIFLNNNGKKCPQLYNKQTRLSLNTRYKQAKFNDVATTITSGTFTITCTFHAIAKANPPKPVDYTFK